MQELGLAQVYKESDVFRQFAGTIDALAFLPVAEVAAGVAHLRQTVPVIAGVFL